MKAGAITPGRVFEEVKAMDLKDWLRSLSDGEKLVVVKAGNGWTWLQSLTSKEVYITDIYERVE